MWTMRCFIVSCSWTRIISSPWVQEARMERNRFHVKSNHRQKRSSRRSPTLGPCVRHSSEIPTLVIDFYQCHVIRRKRNFVIPTDLYDAALARNDLVEKSTVLEFYRDNLITDPGLFTSIQVIDTSTRDRN